MDVELEEGREDTYLYKEREVRTPKRTYLPVLTSHLFIYIKEPVDEIIFRASDPSLDAEVSTKATAVTSLTSFNVSAVTGTPGSDTEVFVLKINRPWEVTDFYATGARERRLIQKSKQPKGNLISTAEFYAVNG